MSSWPPPPPTVGAAPPPGDAPPPLSPVPWEERSRLGLGPSLLGTVELFAMRPREGFVRARRKGDVLGPLLWVALMAFAAALFQLLWSLVIHVPLQELLGAADGRVASLLLITGGGIAQVVFGPITAVAGAFIAAGILHGCLALLGGLDRSLLGFEGSLRAVAYAYTTQLALVVPLAGGVIAFVWMLVLLVIGLGVLHDTTTGRALAAVLVPLLACCLCGALILALFGAAAVGLAGLG
jgi:hypothetical protein